MSVRLPEPVDVQRSTGIDRRTVGGGIELRAVRDPELERTQSARRVRFVRENVDD